MKRLSDPAPADFLERATEHVLRTFLTEPLVTADSSLLGRELSALVNRVRTALDGRVPAPGERAQMDRLRLLSALRAAVLMNWSETDGSLLATMRAFEATERSLREGDGQAAPIDALSGFSRNVLREVSHLLRSPLGSIVMLTETLRQERAGPLTQAQHHQLDIIYRAALSAAATANDLLTLTSREERFEVARRFSVAETVETIANVVRPVTEARRSELVVRMDIERHRLGPASAVGAALLGLALRAALMTREGRVELEASADEGDFLVFSVRSFGAGGAWADETDLFHVFRLDPDSGSYTISQEALAFSAVREIIRSIGSELQVDATPSGTLALRFRVALPVTD